MRDTGKFLSGQDITGKPELFIGAAANPFAQPFEFRALRLAKKIEAGADFVQTQCIYNMERFREFVKQANDLGLTQKVYLLAGVTPMKSLGMAKYMQKNVPGMDVPDAIIKRLEGVDKKKQADEGIKICCEQIEEFRQTKGIAGIHLMPIEWEHRVPEIVERAKLLPRPVV
jgi:methylenetetrahydrofolate reductase (NADPH)